MVRNDDIRVEIELILSKSIRIFIKNFLKVSNFLPDEIHQ